MRQRASQRPVALSALCRRLDIPEEGMLPVVADLFRSAPSSREGGADADRGLLERAERLHDRFVDAQPG
jgi:hypothetical protein